MVRLKNWHNLVNTVCEVVYSWGVFAYLRTGSANFSRTLSSSLPCQAADYAVCFGCSGCSSLRSLCWFHYPAAQICPLGTYVPPPVRTALPCGTHTFISRYLGLRQKVLKSSFFHGRCWCLLNSLESHRMVIIVIPVGGSHVFDRPCLPCCGVVQAFQHREHCKDAFNIPSGAARCSAQHPSSQLPNSCCSLFHFVPSTTED